jgi:hypothetical protein
MYRAFTALGIAAAVAIIPSACQPDDSPKSLRCEMAFVSNQLVPVETCPNANAGDTFSMTISIEHLGDRELDIWADECLRSGGTLRTDMSAKQFESVCFDVDF